MIFYKDNFMTEIKLFQNFNNFFKPISLMILLIFKFKMINYFKKNQIKILLYLFKENKFQNNMFIMNGNNFQKKHKVIYKKNKLNSNNKLYKINLKNNQKISKNYLQISF